MLRFLYKRKVSIAVALALLILCYWILKYHVMKIMYFDINSGKLKTCITIFDIPVSTNVSETNFSKMVEEIGFPITEPEWVEDCKLLWLHRFFDPFFERRPVRFVEANDCYCYIKAAEGYYQISEIEKKKILLWELDRLKNFQKIQEEFRERNREKFAPLSPYPEYFLDKEKDEFFIQFRE